MRISAWSSDVCSSDLVDFGPAERRRRAVLDGDPQTGDAQEVLPRRAAQRLSQIGVGNDVAQLDLVEPQIGRASCRERVVAVRVDLGGRRLIKKKIEDNNYVK